MKRIEERRIKINNKPAIKFILLGFRYLASALPLLSLIGVGIGVGVIFSMLLLGLSRNPSVSNYLVR